MLFRSLETIGCRFIMHDIDGFEGCVREWIRRVIVTFNMEDSKEGRAHGKDPLMYG